MVMYLQIPMMGEVLKGNRPGFRTFLDTYFWKALLPIWDSDGGGTEKVVDSQWMVISDGSPANPPAEANFMVTPQDRVMGNPVIFKAYLNGNYPPPQPLFINGLQTDNGLTTAPIYYPASTTAGAFNGNSYGLTARALCEMGAMAGLSQYTKIADRINTLIAQSYGGLPCSWTTKATSGNPNGLMYAMKRQ